MLLTVKTVLVKPDKCVIATVTKPSYNVQVFVRKSIVNSVASRNDIPIRQSHPKFSTTSKVIGMPRPFTLISASNDASTGIIDLSAANKFRFSYFVTSFSVFPSFFLFNTRRYNSPLQTLWLAPLSTKHRAGTELMYAGTIFR